MNILYKMNRIDDLNFIDSQFRVLVESLITSTTNLKVITVDKIESYRYQGDFYGLLEDVLRVPKEFHFVYGIMNGIYNPTRFDGIKNVFTVLKDENILYMLSTIYSTSEKNNY